MLCGMENPFILFGAVLINVNHIIRVTIGEDQTGLQTLCLVTAQRKKDGGNVEYRVFGEDVNKVLALLSGYRSVSDGSINMC